MTAAYVLAAAAEADLRSIIRYTRQQWGNEQARRYIAILTTGIEQIARGTGKEMSALHPGLLMSRCEHHHIFGDYIHCKPTDDVA